MHSKGKMGSMLGKPWFPYSIAALALVLLGIVSTSLWFDNGERFPRISAGAYYGVIRGIDKDQPLKFFMESSAGSNTILFVVLKNGWMPQLIDGVSPGDSSVEAGWYFPPTITGPDGKFKLVGGQPGSGRLQGTVTQLNGKARGSFEMWHAETDSQSRSNEQEALQLKHQLLLRAELHEVDNQIAESESAVEAQKAEIERLTDFVTEGTNLKSKADQKFNRVKSVLTDYKEKLKVKRAEAQKLESQVEISQRVTSMGKLVSLARESLEREGRWIDSMLISNPDAENMERLNTEYAKGEKIMDLKRAIGLEQDRIARLSSGPDAAPGYEVHSDYPERDDYRRRNE